MANIARDNLDIIRIPRKVILSELVKKLGGREPHYECWSQDGKYWSVVRSAIATREVNTSSKLEQAMGCVDATREGAEEAAAIALIEVLKRTYSFKIDDMNLMKRTEAEHQNEELVKQMDLCASVQNRQSERIKVLTKCTNQLLDDMKFVQESCHDICGTALASVLGNQRSGPLTDMIYAVNYLDEWTEQKIYEHIAKLK